MGNVAWSTIGASDSTAMILTCPACATSYFVDDAKIGAAGRSVRCASCGERWMARLPSLTDGLDISKVSDIEVVAGPEARAAARRAQMAEAALAAMAASAADESPKSFQDSSGNRKKPAAPGASPVVIMAVMAAVLVSLLAGAVLFSAQVVKLWPRSASAYALVGLAANPTGLTLEKIKADRTLKDGRAALTITGAIRNISAKGVMAPPLRITLTDPDGKAVAVKIAKPDGVVLPAHAVRYFAVSVIDPPVRARDLAVDFVLDKPQKAPPQKAEASAKAPQPASPEAPAKAAQPTSPEAHGPVNPMPATEVKPLPAGSPYALPAVTETGEASGTAVSAKAPAHAPARAKASSAHGHD